MNAYFVIVIIKVYVSHFVEYKLNIQGFGYFAVIDNKWQ